ncbi:hypothetical protein A2U01_0115398, partial [Trifolium medium]|nr:hypothetical protein [Trifolium medium]
MGDDQGALMGDYRRKGEAKSTDPNTGDIRRNASI